MKEQAKALLPSRVQTWLRHASVASASRGRSADWKFTRVPGDRLAQYESDLRAAVDGARAIGAEPVIATHANAFVPGAPRDEVTLAQWGRFYPRSAGDVLVQFDSVARDVTLRVGAEMRVRTVDVAGALSGSGGRVFHDFAHFTDEGSARVARLLAPVVREAAAVHSGCSM